MVQVSRANQAKGSNRLDRRKRAPTPNSSRVRELPSRNDSAGRREARRNSQDDIANEGRTRIAEPGSPSSKSTRSTSAMTTDHSSRSGRIAKTLQTSMQQNRTTTTMDFSRTADKDSFRHSVGSVTHTRESQGSTEADPPSHIFMSRSQTTDDRARQMKITLQGFVSNSLFPKLKFITDPDVELRYTDDKNSICNLVVRDCNVVGDQQLWWASAKNIVRHKISEMRNNKNSAIKTAFFGKKVELCFVILYMIMVPLTTAIASPIEKVACR